MQNENSRHGMHSPSLKQTRTNVAEVETEKLHAHFRLGAEYRHTRDMTPIMCHFGSSSYSLSNINSWHCSRPHNFPLLAKRLCFLGCTLATAAAAVVPVKHHANPLAYPVNILRESLSSASVYIPRRETSPVPINVNYKCISQPY